jgi:hypothetical protein
MGLYVELLQRKRDELHDYAREHLPRYDSLHQ